MKNLSNIKIPRKVYRYYNGEYKNVYGSIISSYGSLKWEYSFNGDGSVNINSLPNKKESNIEFSYILFYNHIKCRIDRYVLNTSIPYEVKLIEVPDKSKYIGNSITKDAAAERLSQGVVNLNNQVLKYVFREDLLTNHRVFRSVYTNNGKISQKLILYFLYEVYHSVTKQLKNIGSEIGFHSYHKVFDILAINNYERRLEDLGMDIKQNKIAPLFPLDTTKPILVNLHSDLLTHLGKSDQAFEQLEKLSNVKINRFNYHQGPQVIRDIRRMLRQEPITNNETLDNRIIHINHVISKKINQVIDTAYQE